MGPHMSGSFRLPDLDRRGFLRLTGAAGAAAALAACGGPPHLAGQRARRRREGRLQWREAGVHDHVLEQQPGRLGRGDPADHRRIPGRHPGTKVNLVTAGQNYEEIAQKFQTAQTGGQLPDLVVLSDVWWFRYYMQRSIIPLDSAISATGIELPDYREGLVKDYQYAGAQWAIPWARSTPLFYYNKAHWAAAGLPDKAPATWAEFAEWAPKLKSAGVGTQNAFQLPALADYAGWTFQNNLWGEGGGWSKDFTVTCDSPESVAALELSRSPLKDGWAGVSQGGRGRFRRRRTSRPPSSTGSLPGC